jgi:hypothetical protein
VKFMRLLYPSISRNIKFWESSDPALMDSILDYENKSMVPGYKVLLHADTAERNIC